LDSQEYKGQFAYFVWSIQIQIRLVILLFQDRLWKRLDEKLVNFLTLK